MSLQVVKAVDLKFDQNYILCTMYFYSYFYCDIVWTHYFLPDF
jgi:hypothetical protein